VISTVAIRDKLCAAGTGTSQSFQKGEGCPFWRFDHKRRIITADMGAGENSQLGK
jgi:hypothetical protein